MTSWIDQRKIIPYLIARPQWKMASLNPYVKRFCLQEKLPLSPACTKFIQIIRVPKENEQEFFLCSS